MTRKKKAPETKVKKKCISKEVSKTKNNPGKYSKDELQTVENHLERLKKAPLNSSTLAAYINGKQNEEEGLLTLALFTEVTGSPDYGVQMLLFDQAAKTFTEIRDSEGKVADETTIKTVDNALALLSGINPQDEMEGMLAVQMVGVHNMAMDAMRLAIHPDQYAEAKESLSNQAIKLLRTFSAQMEALDKHRRKGQQKVVVEHVHVHEGGQAIVGNVSGGGGGRNGS